MRIPIAHHTVPHIRDLAVDSGLLTARYSRECATFKCDGACCARGVWIDLAQRDAILASAELVQRYMAPQQEHDPARWFDGQFKDDLDFPSGRATGTAVHNDGCVFLDPARRCVLHAVDVAGTLSTRLKPFYCRLYPLVLNEGVLTLDEPAGGDRPICCTQTVGGQRNVFEVCAGEFEDVLGSEGLRELHAALAVRQV